MNFLKYKITISVSIAIIAGVFSYYTFTHLNTKNFVVLKYKYSVEQQPRLKDRITTNSKRFYTNFSSNIYKNYRLNIEKLNIYFKNTNKIEVSFYTRSTINKKRLNSISEIFLDMIISQQKNQNDFLTALKENTYIDECENNFLVCKEQKKLEKIDIKYFSSTIKTIKLIRGVYKKWIYIFLFTWLLAHFNYTMTQSRKKDDI